MIECRHLLPGKGNDHYLLEFLRNGKDWGEDIPFAKKVFSFGVRKSRMIIASWDLLEEFATTEGAQPYDGESRTIYVPNTAFVNVTITKHDVFMRDGLQVSLPYLHFEFGGEHWGLGLRKVKAVLAHRPDIEFVSRQA